MTDSFVNPIFGEQARSFAEVPTEVETQGTDVEAQGTGQPDVDEVLRSLDALDALVVDEHVAVFEQAHETLRLALADARPDLRQESPAAGRS